MILVFYLCSGWPEPVSIRSAPKAKQEAWIDVQFAKYPAAEENKHLSYPVF